MRWNKKEKSYKKLQKRYLARIRTSDHGYYNYPSYPLSYFCASLMNIMNDTDVILSIPVSPVYIIVLALFNGISLPTFVNHTIESSIYLKKQVWFFYLMIREGAWNTENQDFKLRNRGTQIHFIGTSGRVPTGKASIFSCMPKFCVPKLWP